MSRKSNYQFNRVALVLILAMIISGCGSKPAAYTTTPSQTTTTNPLKTATEVTAAATPVTSHQPVVATTTPGPSDQPVVDKNVLYHDDFTNPSSGWPEEKFDNYFVGYHEPEYYHVEITSPNYKTTVFEPEKKSFGDASIEVRAFTASSKTAKTGDFSFGFAFRRSGDQYYAFTISQRTKKWYFLKSSPNALVTLSEGTDDTIHAPDAEDVLRVDAQGSNFTFLINGQVVGQVTDSDYSKGEVGLYLQTFDITNAHVHFDELTISNIEGVSSQGSASALYHDGFTNPSSGWPEKKFDNYFVGYHEPEYYHVEVTSPNYKTTVFEPEKKSFGDASIEVKAFTASSKTAKTGDFSFGFAFRRSGDQYYAFTISQRTKKWYFLKSSPNALVTLLEGTDDTIHAPDAEDVLRVDAHGTSFTFLINGQIVGWTNDSDYSKGEVGLYLQTFDITNAHVHFDELTINPYKLTFACDVVAHMLYVRSGPGTEYPSSKFIKSGEKIQPVGRTADGSWLLLASDENKDQNWVFYSEGFLSCNEAVDSLPITPP